MLWSSHQRNLLLQLAVQETISVCWTADILEEWLRNVDATLRTRLEARTLSLMRLHFPDALVSDISADRDVGRTDAKDRHVALAALAVAPCALVTWNLTDFDRKRLAAQSVDLRTPDAFLAERFDEDPELLFHVTKDAQANLTRSAPAWEGYLATLEKKHKLRAFVKKLRDFQRANRPDVNDADAIDMLARTEWEPPPIDPPASRKRK